MAVSPSDFALYSRVTGRAIPSDRGARMKMAPEVNRFIRNREYERPQKTALQKGADLLGKAAMIGGTLAAAHAIGGGFKGQTAEKVADVVENMTKTGVTGAEGGAGKPDTRIVDEWLNSPGNSSFVEYENAAKAATDMAPLSNELYGALQQEEMLNNLAQDTVLPAKPEVSAQIESPRQKTEEFLDNLTNRRTDAGGLSRMERLMNRERFGERSDLMEDEVSDEYARRRRVEKGLEEPSPEEQFNLHTTGSYFDWEIGEPSANQARKAQKKLNMPELPPGMQNMVTTPNIDVLEADWKSGYPFEYDQTDPPSGGGGGPLAPIAPDEGGFRGPYVRDDQLATTSSPTPLQKVGKFLGGQRQWGIDTLDTISRQGGGRDARKSAPALATAIAGRGLIPGTGGGLLPGSGTSLGRNAVSGFWDAAGNLVRRDPIVDGAVRGLEGIGNINVFGNSVGDAVGNALGAVPGLNEAVNLGGVKIAELGGLGLGTVADSAVKDTLKLGVDARRFAENRFGFRPLSWQETAVQTGNLLDQGWSRDAAAKVAARNNPLLAEGMSRHDEAIGSLQKNIQAVLPTTRPTGQVAIGENAQLNRHPDRPPGETDMAPSRLIQQDEPAIAPARLIQQFSDKGLLGEGSLTPDDLEIRTDVDVSDPVNFTQLFGKRVGRGEKAKFISGLKERNKDIYSNASDLPARKVGGKGKMGTSGLAGSMAGVSDWEDRDSKDPLHGVKQFAAGFMEKPDLSDKAAEDVGRRMAEREEQGNLFEDDNDDPWYS